MTAFVRCDVSLRMQHFPSRSPLLPLTAQRKFLLHFWFIYDNDLNSLANFLLSSFSSYITRNKSAGVANLEWKKIAWNFHVASSPPPSLVCFREQIVSSQSVPSSHSFSWLLMATHNCQVVVSVLLALRMSVRDFSTPAALFNVTILEWEMVF